MSHCYKECFQVFFPLFRGADIKNFHWKTWCWKKVRVLKEMLDWFWMFVWIFNLIPTSNNVLFGFTYVILFTKTDFVIDFTWKIWIFLLQWLKLYDFLCFLINSKVILFFGERRQFLEQMFGCFLVFVTKKDTFWNLWFLMYKEFIGFAINFSFYDKSRVPRNFCRLVSIPNIIFSW